MKKPQTDRAMRIRAVRAARVEQTCPKHGAKFGRSVLAFRCGCPARIGAES